MCLDLELFSEEVPLWFDSCKRPPPVSDHSVLHFGWSLTGGSTVKYLEALCTVDFAVFLLPFSNIVLYSGYHGL